MEDVFNKLGEILKPQLNIRFKFRAWHKSTNRMFNIYSLSPDYIFEDTLNGVGNSTVPAKTKDCEIMQYTGLKDKNGNEIFEGDIVKNGLSGTWIIQPIESGSMSLLGICKQYKDKNFDISALNYNVEVIGNIYENPELI